MSVVPARPVKLLLDENLSPTVARRLREDGHDVVHVRDRGMLAATDPEVLAKAFAEDRIVVTSNVGDFAKMAQSVEVHGGIVLVEDGGLLREEQEQVVRRAVTLIEAEYGAGRDIVNRVLRIGVAGDPTFDAVP